MVGATQNFDSSIDVDERAAVTLVTMNQTNLLLAVFVSLLVACSSGTPSGSAGASQPGESKDSSPKPPLAKVDGTRTDLLFRYRAEDAYRTATSLAEIPVGSRSKVHVIDLSKTPKERGDAQWVQVFDLSKDGQFSGRLVPRSQLEEAMKKEHEAKPKAPRVIMYSTEWCGVCKKARKFMTKNGVAFVEKDIEKDAGANRELRKKSAAAGVKTGGVPVFDVGGKIVSGFDPGSLLKLAGKK